MMTTLFMQYAVLGIATAIIVVTVGPFKSMTRSAIMAGIAFLFWPGVWFYIITGIAREVNK